MTYVGPVTPGRSRSAMQWLFTGIVGVSLGLACIDDEHGFCSDYAETVAGCCYRYKYSHLQSKCDQDLGDAASLGAGCAQSVRELYMCAEAQACPSRCQTSGPDPCALQRQAILRNCAESPPPPAPPEL